MLDLAYRGEKIFKPLEGKIDGLIEVFVNLLGEDFRSHIEDAISSAKIYALRGQNKEIYDKVMEEIDEKLVVAKEAAYGVGLGLFEDSISFGKEDLVEKAVNREFDVLSVPFLAAHRKLLAKVDVYKNDFNIKEWMQLLKELKNPEKAEDVRIKIEAEARRIYGTDEYQAFNKLAKQRAVLDKEIREKTDDLQDSIKAKEIKLGEISKMSPLVYNDYMLEKLVSNNEMVGWEQTRFGGYVRHILNKNLQLMNVMMIPNLFNTDTQVSIHEMGHVILATLMSVNQELGTYIIKSGLELYECPINDSAKLRKLAFDDDGNLIDVRNGLYKRPYELLNEVAHDIFATRAREEYEKKFGRIGYKPNFKSQYSNGFDIFEPFLDRHLGAFKTCMKANDFEPVKKYFGFKIYNQMAKVITDYVLEKDTLAAKIERVKEKIDNPEYAGEIDFLNDLLNKTKIQIERLTKKYNCQLLRIDLELHKRNGMETSQVEQLLAEAEAEAAPIYAEEERERREEEQRLEEERRAEEAEAEKERLAEEARIKEEERKAKLLKRCEGFFYPLYVEYDDEKKTLKYTYDGVLRTSKNYPLLYKYLNKIATSDKIESLLASIGQKIGKSEATYYDIRQNVKNMKILTEEERNFVKFVVESNELFHKMGKYLDKNYDKWVNDRIKERFDEDGVEL